MCERMRWLVQILVVGITACFIQTQSFAVEFRSASGYAVGSSPQSVVVGDFNGDGKMDLAVLNTVSNNVSILLGNGDGTFQAAKNFDAGSNPSGIFLGDFNGDGKLDLGVFMSGNASNAVSGEVRILLGNGDGTFQALAVTTLTASAVTLAPGDFNGDKKADLILGNVDPNSKAVTLQLLLGNGDGTFQAAQRVPSNGLQSPNFAIADFDKDGKLDLAVNETGGVLVLPGHGDGTFGPGANATPLTIGTVSNFWVADVNGDGDLDLIVDSRLTSCGGTEIHFCSTAQKVGVFLGAGNGSFASEQVFASVGSFLTIGGLINSIAIGDFNGDGRLDIVYRQKSGTGFELSVRLGKGDGTFAPSILMADPGPVAAAQDLNGDKLTDLLVVDPSNSNVDVLLNDSPTSGADIGIVSSGASPEPVGVGQNLTYTADILNEGPHDATGVILKDSLPASVSFVSATASQGSCSQSGQVVSCAIDGLPDAGDVRVTIVVTPTVSGTTNNTMEVSATEPDLALANNSSTQTNTVLPVYTLTVTESGNAPGSVSTSNISPKNSGDGSVDCGSTCSAKFLSGTQVTLSAGVDLGNFFTGWGGACTGNDSCTVTMSRDQTVNANFVKGNILSVTLAGQGAGVVEDQSAAIFICTSTNGDCSPSLLPGSTISIQAIPSGNSIFGGWSGACTGTNPTVCSVTMNGNETVTANFNPPPDFTVNPSTTSLSVKRGGEVSEALTFPAQGGFSAAIALKCSVAGTTPTPTCGISPNIVTPGNSATLTVNTAGISAALAPQLLGQTANVYAASLPFGGLVLFLLTAGADKKRRRTWFLCVALLTATILPVACGGGSRTPPPPVAQNYTVTVTATSGATQHSTNINVTVN
jgi:uncharacterized repeat protein (TIGR01451 family)